MHAEYPAISRLFPAIFLLCLCRKGSKASGGGAGGGGKGRGGRRADEVQVAKKKGLGLGFRGGAEGGRTECR